MLTAEQIQKNKMDYFDLLTKLNIDLTPITKYLNAVDYFNKPATTQYFNSFPGGLCKYSLDLYYELAQLCNAYFPNKYTQEDVIKVALFKDLYRAEMYEGFMKNVKDDSTGTWSSIQAYRVKDERPTFGDIGFSSYMIAKYFVTFTDEQIEAIVQAKSTDAYMPDLHEIMRSYPLVTLTKMADMVAMYLEK